ncbi:hypothetical protein FJTKL_08881 [Diaporthe vaccinii]|uniref:Cytochrome c oxidase assembly factor 3 mitochondrial coiled-coil domain-containing protein n=1 Tax=Diaporthe vaccinii TaxID=105482 RepID=A0ABR4EPZ0_9PEZI
MAGIDHSSYYTRKNAQSAALLRARRPYLVKNAVTGLAIAGVAAGICASETQKPTHLQSSRAI